MSAALERLERIHTSASADAAPEPPATPLPCGTYADALAVLANLPAAIRATRDARGLSQRQAGQELGYTLTAVNAWETGAHQPYPKAAVVILRWVAGERPGGVATCPSGHEWNLATTRQRADGRRYCLTCAAEREARSARECRNGHPREVERRDRWGRRWCPECRAESEAERRRRKTARRRAAS